MMGAAKVRPGFMAQLAPTAWGLEAGVLRSTHMALITSRTRYEFATYGGYLFGKWMDRPVSQIANVAARRITGAHRTARLEVRMTTAGLVSVRNKYIRQRGGLVVRALEAHNRPLNDWVRKCLRRA